MKIKGTCAHCGRDFLAEQVVDAHGHCPWCGQTFDRDYTANLAAALQQADAAGRVLRGALERIAEIEPAFDLDEGSVLQPLREALRSRRRRGARA